jgi:single-strand DNA-binding protein
MNVLCATGHLGGDSELRFMPNGKPVLNFNFPLSSGYGDKQQTTWLRCALFGDRAEKLSDMLKKGTQIAIQGELVNRQYADKSGVEKTSLELTVRDITLLGKKEPHDMVQKPKEKAESFDEMEPDIPF